MSITSGNMNCQMTLKTAKKTCDGKSGMAGIKAHCPCITPLCITPLGPFIRIPFTGFSQENATAAYSIHLRNFFL